jgi:hypothetical protein
VLLGPALVVSAFTSLTSVEGLTSDLDVSFLTSADGVGVGMGVAEGIGVGVAEGLGVGVGAGVEGNLGALSGFTCIPGRGRFCRILFPSFLVLNALTPP